MESGELVRQEPQALAYRHEMSVEEVVARVTKVRELMRQAMHEGVHYGKIPGTDKPTLLKPGAELLNLLFRLDPQYQSTELWDGEGHLTIKSICTLFHIPTGQRLGSGEGSCSTRESKYAFRHAKRKCPKCGAEQINRSKFPPKDNPRGEPGWYCHAKGGGCGGQFAAADPAVTGQQVGLVANPNLADTYNTVLKMSNKRSLIAAVLNVTAASDTFTQDLEEMEENERAQQASAPPAQTPATQAGPPAVSPLPPVDAPPSEHGGGVITGPQAKRAWAIARGSGWDEAGVKALLAEAGVESMAQVPVGAYETLVQTLKAGPTKGTGE